MKLQDILPTPAVEETEQREIVIALRQDGQQVGAINMTKIVTNVLDRFFRPAAAAPAPKGLVVVK